MKDEDYKKLDKVELLKLAELGISEAQVEYGYRFLSGASESPVDLKESFRWFTLASEQDDPNGLFNLATMYKMGLGVERDLELAFKLYSRSADLGLAISQYYLGDMYKNGLGTEHNSEEALKWTIKSYSNSEPKVPQEVN